MDMKTQLPYRILTYNQNFTNKDVIFSLRLFLFDAVVWIIKCEILIKSKNLSVLNK